MKAAICRAFGAPFVIADIAIDDPCVDEVAIDVHACSICHSDIVYADGGWGGELPMVLGHEASGMVTRVGADVSNVSSGDRVIVTMVRSCGTCGCCSRGLYGSCETEFTRDPPGPLRDGAGNPISQGLKTAAFAEKAVVHHSQVVKIDEQIPFDVAALVACGVITGYGAVANSVTIWPGATTCVIGCGGVGLNAVQGAAINGASAVIAVDISSEKLAMARRFGATDALNSTNCDMGTAIADLTGGRGADFVFVTVGAKSVIDAACSCLAPGGSVVLVGIPASGVMAKFDPVNLASYSQRIVGSKMGASDICTDIAHLLSLYRDGRLLLDELITARYQFDDINKAMAHARSGRGVKNVLLFD